MQVPQLVGCSLIALGTGAFGADVAGVTSRYATWRFRMLQRKGLTPVPEVEAAYVGATKRYARWVGYVFVPIGLLGVVAAFFPG